MNIHCEICGQMTNGSSFRMVAEVERFVNLNHPEITELGGNYFSYQSADYQYHLLSAGFMNTVGKIGLFLRKEGHHVVCSSSCITSFLSKHTTHFNQHYLGHAIVNLPVDNVYFPTVYDPPQGLHQEKICECCNKNFPSSNKMYQEYEVKNFDIRIGDSELAVKLCEMEFDYVFTDFSNGGQASGRLYLYKLGNFNGNRYFCSNECAYQQSLRNNVLYFYPDFLQKAEYKVVSIHIKEANRKLGNPEYRGI